MSLEQAVVSTGDCGLNRVVSHLAEVHRVTALGIGHFCREHLFLKFDRANKLVKVVESVLVVRVFLFLYLELANRLLWSVGLPRNNNLPIHI